MRRAHPSSQRLARASRLGSASESYRRRAARRILGLEALESRHLLAAFEWIGGTSGNDWQVETNWRNLDSGQVGDGVPGATDFATLKGGSNVVLTRDVQLADLTIDTGFADRILNTQQWTLTAGGGTVKTGQLWGQFVNTGSLTLAGVNGVTSTTDGAILLWGSLQNLGTVHHLSGNLLTSQFLNPIGHVINASGSVYELSDTAGILNLWSTGTFENQGLLRKINGPGAATITAKVVNDVRGRIEVVEGALELGGAEQVLGGTIEVAPDARLDLNLATVGCCALGTIDLNGEVTLTGGGSVRLQRGEAFVNGVLHTSEAAFEVTALADESVTNATLRGTGTLDGNVTIRRGRIGAATFGSQQDTARLTNRGTLSFVGDSEMSTYLSGSTLVNDGTIVIRPGAAANAFVLEGAHLENRPTGVVEFQTNSVVPGAFGNGVGPGTMNNAGTVRVAAGVTSVRMPSVTFFNAGGVVDVRAGTLDLRDLRNADSARVSGGRGGHFVVSSGATIDWRNPGLGVNSPVFTGTFTGEGDGRVLWGNAVYDAAILDEPTGLFQWDSGRLQGTLENRGLLLVTHDVDLPGTLTNRGTLAIADGVSVIMQPPFAGEGRLNNAAGGIVDLAGNAAFQWGLNGTLLDSRNPLIVNEGIWRAASGVVTVAPKFDNLGTVETVGTISFTNPRPLVFGDARIGLPGTWIARQGGRIQFPNSASYFDTLDGSVTLDGIGSTFTGIEELTRIDGALRLTNGGTLTIAGAVTNRGTLELGPSSSLNVTGYTQDAQATFVTRVAGPTILGRLIVSGAATLGGVLETGLSAGFEPADSDRFSVVTAASIAGTFSQINANGLVATVTPTTVTLGLPTAATDLVVEALSVPGANSPLVPGQSIQVQYTVHNLSGHVAIGPWSDLVFFSSDRQLDPTDVVVGRSASTQQLAPFESVTRTVSLIVPNQPGMGYFIVAADAAGVVLDVNRRNNVRASSTRFEITAPSLHLGQKFNVTFAPGETKYFALTIPQDAAPVRVSAQFSAADAGQLSMRRDALPLGADDDLVATTVLVGSNRTAQIALPDTLPGQYFVAVTSRLGGAVDILANEQALTLDGFANERNLATQWIAGDSLTLTVQGAGFTASTQFQLGGVAAQTVDVLNPNTAVVTFAPLVAGSGQLVTASRGAATASYSGKAFNVSPESSDVSARWARTPNWAIDVAMPAAIRPLREVRATVTFRNNSAISQPAPLIQLFTDNGIFRFPSEATLGGSSLLVLGVKATGRPDGYAPGETGTFDVVLFPTQFGAHVDSQILATVVAEQQVTPARSAGVIGGVPPQLAEMPIATSTLNALRPATISPQAWNEVVFPNVLRLVGDSVSSYATALRSAATVLGKDGVDTHNVSQLVTYLIELADQFGAISRRFELTAFGRGVENPFDLRTSVDSAGNVFVESGFSVRPFFKDGTRYRPITGDLGQLTTRSGGGFQLTEADGSMIAFATNGTWEFRRDRFGRTTTATYTIGQLSAITNYVGDVTTLTYSAAGRISAMTDAVGRVTTFAYDASGDRLTAIISPDGVTTFELNPATTGPQAYTVHKVTGPNGVPTSFTYDDSGRVAQQIVGDQDLVTTFVYGTNENLGRVTISDGSGRSAEYWQGEFGQTTALKDATGNAVDWKFDTNGRLVGVASGADVVRYQRNTAGSITSALTSSGGSTQFGYDATGLQSVQLIDALGQVTESLYDDRQSVVERIGPDGLSERYTYDATGNRVFYRTVGGQSVRDTVNVKGLVTRREFSDGSQLDFAFDVRRNVTSVVETSASGSTRTVLLEYDGADRVTKVTYPDGRSVSYHYDAHGQRDQLSTSTGLVFDYAFDALGRLASVQRGGIVEVTYEYDALSRLAAKRFANGTSTLYQYDAADRVSRIEQRGANNTLLDFQQYTFSSRGLMVTRTTSAGTTRYEYDAEGQLVAATLPDNSVVDYHADALGNRVGYTSNERHQYVTGPKGETYQYDSDGNLTRVVPVDGSQPTVYAYDGRGRLASVTSATGSWQFEYDPLGQRSAVVFNGVRTDLLIDAVGGADGLADVLAEFRGPTLTASYLLADGVEARFDAADAANFYHFDALGNTVAMTDELGAISARYDYLPFGEIVSETGPSAATNPFTFGGQWGVADRGNGIYDMRARAYDPSLGRFLQPDPLGFGGGDANPQRYAYNNPLSYIDPSGLSGLTSYGFGLVGTYEGSPLFAEVLGPRALAQAMTRYMPGVYNPLFAGDFATTSIVGSNLPAIYEGAVETVAEEAVVEGAVVEGTVVEGATVVEGVAGTGTATVAGGSLVLGGVLLVPAALVGGEIANYHIEQYEANRAGAPPTIQSDTVRKIIDTQTNLHPALKTLIDQYRQDHNGDAPSLDTLLLWLDAIRAGEQALTKTQTTQLTPEDPNEIVGPAGVGTQRFVRPDGPFPYTIFFQNKPTASAPAQEVFVTQQLDSDLDWSTFELDTFGWADQVYSVPAGRTTYATRVSYPQRDLVVDVSASFDATTGKLTWTFRSLDPIGLDLTADPLAGFLPPDDVNGVGQGFVSYRVQPKANATTGTRYDAVATIVFDTEAPLDTPAIFHTADAGSPASAVAPLAAQTQASQFTVSWSGSDDAGELTGVGVATFDIYVATDTGPFTLWQAGTTATSAEFTGAHGHRYSFFSVARDQLGHVEISPLAADAVTYVNLRPWHNALRPFDVDGDGFIVPLDALILINRLNALGSQLPAPPTNSDFPPPYYDVNDDGMLTPLDALLVINELNRAPAGEGEEVAKDAIANHNSPDPLGIWELLLEQIASDVAGRLR